MKFQFSILSQNHKMVEGGWDFWRSRGLPPTQAGPHYTKLHRITSRHFFLRSPMRRLYKPLGQPVMVKSHLYSKECIMFDING